MGHIVLDLTSLAYQPESRERSARPTKLVTFCSIETNQHIQLASKKWMTTKMTNLSLLCNLHPKKKSRSMNLLQYAEFLHHYEEEKNLQSGEIRLPHWNKMYQEPRVSDHKTSRVLENSDGEALQKIINKLSDVRNLKDLHLKHHHMSSAQFKKRTTHLDFPGKLSDLYKHVVKTCPSCNF